MDSPNQTSPIEEDAPPRLGLRRRVHLILEVDRFGDRSSRLVDKALIGLIVLNVMAAVLQTESHLYEVAPWLFDGIEAASLVIFGLEYLLRVWCSPEAGAYRGRVRFMLQPMMLIDLAVLVVPVYFDLRPLRILRLLRLGRYSPRLRLFGRVVAERRDELFVGVFVAFVLLVASSTAMYHVEKNVNESFDSIPGTMWWGVATLTTVGYGDAVPITPPGKALGAIVALLGIGVFALPAGILANGFGEALDRERSAGRHGHGPAGDPGTEHGDTHPGGTCPECGASVLRRP
ncbi:MAG: ion transporter [Planctomycetota bacterium]|nr:ion transporter [Planctomycetota bacterium]